VTTLRSFVMLFPSQIGVARSGLCFCIILLNSPSDSARLYLILEFFLPLTVSLEFAFRGPARRLRGSLDVMVSGFFCLSTVMGGSTHCGFFVQFAALPGGRRNGIRMAGRNVHVPRRSATPFRGRSGGRTAPAFCVIPVIGISPALGAVAAGRTPVAATKPESAMGTGFRQPRR